MKKHPSHSIKLDDADVLQIHAVFSKNELQEVVEDLAEIKELKAAGIDPMERNDAIVAIVVTNQDNVYKVFVLDRNSLKPRHLEPTECVVWTYPRISVREETNPSHLSEELEDLFHGELLMEVDSWKCKTFGLDKILSFVRFKEFRKD